MTAKICPSCHQQVSDDAEFCALCGSALDSTRDVEIALEQDRNICPEWGTPYIAADTACPNCGKNLKIAAPQPEKKLCSTFWRHLHGRR
jgi:predicted amidophosphoribosyltransferase